MAVVWCALVLLCLLMYVLLDGYDLAIGISMLFEREAGRRREMLEQVALAWDGNETWLVLLGVSLWAGSPAAFGTVLPHAYLALVVMLFSLIVRGVAVEMASQAPPARWWERAFAVASLVAALAQGVGVSTLVQKLTVTGGGYSGSAFGALSWFSVLAAVTVTCLYLTLGYAYVKLKTTGDLRATAGRRGTVAAGLAGALIAASQDGRSPGDAPAAGRRRRSRPRLDYRLAGLKTRNHDAACQPRVHRLATARLARRSPGPWAAGTVWRSAASAASWPRCRCCSCPARGWPSRGP